ncbi:cell division protein [Phenylobacterium sp.]|uniref:cell division protein FtsL n=1 Tax=Phenylobacterium sp. TaxID=1871053 RepID=UPI0039837567
MSLLDRRIRGFRLVDMVALGALMALILGVYLAKTIAGRERAEIARIERQIDAEKTRIRLLQAEVSHQEQPQRLERLSSAYLGLQPVSLKREVTIDGLAEVARREPPPMPPPPPVVVELAAPEAEAPVVQPTAPVAAELTDPQP